MLEPQLLRGADVADDEALCIASAARPLSSYGDLLKVPTFQQMTLLAIISSITSQKILYIFTF